MPRHAVYQFTVVNKTMNTILKSISAIILVALSFYSCKENDEIKPDEKGQITIEFDNTVGEDDLQLNTEYTNAAGETFIVTKLNYYISNISLKTTNGVEYIVPQDESYFLIMEGDPESQEVTIENVPAGDYNEVKFTIGVDSLRSTMDISKRTGVLDPAGENDMYWVWNSGYIFFKMEGTSPASTQADHKFYFHIGGFGGYDTPTINNIKEKTISMGSARAEVRSGKKPEVHLHADVQKVFGTPPFKLADYSAVMLGDFSTTISSNYVDMFEFEHVHN
jgi:hypothetical protein